MTQLHKVHFSQNKAKTHLTLTVWKNLTIKTLFLKPEVQGWLRTDWIKFFVKRVYKFASKILNKDENIFNFYILCELDMD